MKKLELTFFFILSFVAMALADPQINEVNLFTPSVEQFGKFEAQIDLDATYSNPYDYDQITVSAAFTSPNGQVTVVDGFYMLGYTLITSNGNLNPTGSQEFRVRFSPNTIGSWNFTISVTDASGSVSSAPYSFECTAPGGANHGFVRAGMTNYLEFDDGSQYIPIGENIAWQNNNPYLNYINWLTGLSQNGGNFFRLWHAHWGLGIEWKNGNGFQGLRRYKETNSFYQDWLYDYCAENGIYVMLALQHHGPVSTNVNPNWNDSPYNAANGGPCQSTVEFFTDEEARAHTKNRYRYIVARWGYSRAILCWELFNEVHWTDNFQANKGHVADWHFEMAEYLKSIDPYGHIVTTSYGEDTTDENVWAHPDIDMTQTHIYFNTSNIERVLAIGNRKFLEEFGKPTLNGEFGLGTSASLANTDPDGIHLHNSLWGGLFSGGLGTAMTWWWDSYIHPLDLYHHFFGVAQIVEEVPFLEENMRPAESYVEGAPGDLSLTPSLGWGGIGENEITILGNGTVLPSGAALGVFLYGFQWNTQFRSPPVFSVNYPSEGTFSVQTGSETGTAPKMAIWLDGNLVLEQNASVNATYTIDVPAGMHDIKVDNTGTDWITIASYSFEGLGSQIDAYVLISEGENVAAGWALNNLYNHQNVVPNGAPAPTPPAHVVIDGFQNGSYSVRWFDPLTGVAYGGEEITVNNGTIEIPLNPFQWDVAFIVDNMPVSSRSFAEHIDFSIYPNPIQQGAALNLVLPSENNSGSDCSLLDASGKTLTTRPVDLSSPFIVPADLPAGMYWVRVNSGNRIGIKPLVIGH